MTEREIAEGIMHKGIDAILTALSMFCSKGHCEDCAYLNKSDDTCNVVNYICEHEEITTLNRVPYGDRESDYCEDPHADDDWRDMVYNV